MQLDVDRLTTSYERVRAGKESRHSVADRIQPSIFQYDYLALTSLAHDIASCIEALPEATTDAIALDLGADKSPYRRFLEGRGYVVKTLDLSANSEADYHGSAEDTGLPGDAFDVVLCTQVLEHTKSPLAVIQEIRRILKPGGFFIGSAPHVWFFHPHPGDYWRFTQQGIVELCRSASIRVIALYGQGGSVLTTFQICNFLLYGVIGRWGAPAFLVLNVLGRTIDGALRNSLFCHNFAWLARRPGSRTISQIQPG